MSSIVNKLNAMQVAIIPARGGSKRIPRKNIREFSGKPIIAYSIECALQSNLFDRIIVTTDDSEIKGVAERYGAEVPFKRPAELADDLTFPTPVIGHAVDWLRSQGAIPSAVCCIFPTGPFMRKEDLQRSYEIFSTGAWDYVFPATEFAYPIFRSFQNKDKDGVRMFFPEHFNTRSQDLPVAMHDAGQFYWGRPEAWLKGLPVFGNYSTVVTIPRWRVQDIDTPEDWEQAEIKWKVLQAIEAKK